VWWQLIINLFIYSADSGSKYTDGRDQPAGSQVGSSAASSDLVSSPTASQPAATADLIDLMSSGSPEYRGQMLTAAHLQVRPRPTPPKKAQSC